MRYILGGIIASCIGIGSVANANVEIEERQAYVESVMNTATAYANQQTVQLNLGPSVDVTGFIQTGWGYSNGGGLDSDYGFFVERARLNIGGDLGSDNMVSYLVSGQWDSTSSNFDLLNAVVTFRMLEFADIEVGQFVPTFYSGYVDDPTSLTTYNYSVTALTFGQGRGQGVQLSRSFGDFCLSGFYNNGFNDFSGIGGSDYAVGVSALYHFNPSLNFNAGFAFTEDYNTYTVGAVWAKDNFSIDLDWISNDAGGGWNNWSLVSTFAYQFTGDLEGFAQWEYGEYGGDLSLLTVGANYDIADGLVWTNTLGYALDSLGSNFITDNTGWTAGSSSGQYVLRSVITLSF